MKIVFSDDGEIKVLTVEIVTHLRTKPFLGGYRSMPQDIEYHHAEVQTEKYRKRTWSQQMEGIFFYREHLCRSGLKS